MLAHIQLGKSPDSPPASVCVAFVEFACIIAVIVMVLLLLLLINCTVYYGRMCRKGHQKLFIGVY